MSDQMQRGPDAGDAEAAYTDSRAQDTASHRHGASASLRYDLTRAVTEMADAGIALERAQRACDPEHESDVAAAIAQLRYELRELTRRAATIGQWLAPRAGRR